MQNRSSQDKRASVRDAKQLGRHVLDVIVSSAEPRIEKPTKNPAVIALSRLCGVMGGKARAEKLSSAKRRAIAKKAAEKPWGHDSSV